MLDYSGKKPERSSGRRNSAFLLLQLNASNLQWSWSCLKVELNFDRFFQDLCPPSIAKLPNKVSLINMLLNCGVKAQLVTLNFLRTATSTSMTQFCFHLRQLLPKRMFRYQTSTETGFVEEKREFNNQQTNFKLLIWNRRARKFQLIFRWDRQGRNGGQFSGYVTISSSFQIAAVSVTTAWGEKKLVTMGTVRHNKKRVHSWTLVAKDKLVSLSYKYDPKYCSNVKF